MPRRARLVIPNTPHHVTQRGSRKGLVFFCDEDRLLYLDLLRTYAARYANELLAYCLMDNHVHHVIVPGNEASLSQTLKVTHMRYATIVNGRQRWTGHLWQERFFSAPLDEDYMWTAIRYVELNPVKAGMVIRAEDYRWSSALGHCNNTYDPNMTQSPVWRGKIAQRDNWQVWLQGAEDPSNIKLLRERTSRDLPCGSELFIKALEEKLGKPVLPAPRGRPKLNK
ncbi:MAG: transposase [Deltaproteobacteria bacterium]|nr:transposase [Deltaproteobacteria bacterium]